MKPKVKCTGGMYGIWGAFLNFEIGPFESKEDAQQFIEMWEDVFEFTYDPPEQRENGWYVEFNISID
ncbi:hypothetical protein DRN86_03865 [Candidatus Geothermarchaeota archaeon]|nr:MAG: hypothetical protein DRN86_03865 [Candidatus Geothermarchaeota archaeon]